MESSPLVKAHDHARAAAVATRQASDTTVAINEHTQAAGEFANAARVTSSVEALRTLKLLEEHHRKLAEILKLPAEPTIQPGDHDQSEKPLAEKGDAVHDASIRRESTVDSPTNKSTQMPGLAPKRNYASREMSSSIASNLASARGIRSKYRGQPLAPSISNDQAGGNVDSLPRPQGPKSKMQTLIETQPGKPTWVPPTLATQVQADNHGKNPASPRSAASPTLSDDGGYTRFYNTFGSLINKISAPLAFAGLPLIQEESTLSEQPESPEVSPTKRRAHPSPSTTLEPDLSKIYSRATMRALAREGHGTNDSLYVVPTSGHTMSYANILSFAEKEKRRLESAEAADEDDDDFVDARESPVNLSPGTRRRVGRAQNEKDLLNKVEELWTENKSLKDAMDKLTRRLHAFEASAQNSAMALAESYRLMRPGSPSAAGGGSSKVQDEALQRRSHELEEQLTATLKQMERLEKDNRKMQKTLDKYREKWEMLKAGAKARRDAQGGASESVEDASTQG